MHYLSDLSDLSLLLVLQEMLSHSLESLVGPPLHVVDGAAVQNRRERSNRIA